MSYHSYYSSSEFSSSSSSHGMRLAPQTTARIAREVRELIVSPESGVYLVVDEATGLPHSLHELTAEMEGPADTPYVGKYFLLRFTFGPDFPTTPPTAHFLTKVYHPNVDISTGAICVNTLKRDWKASHTMKHCLAVIRCLLLEPFPESSLNEEAGKLFMESYQEYYKRTKLHADIHGRTTSVKPITIDNESSTTTDEAKCENSSSNTSTSNNNDETMRGILKHTSHNTSSTMSVMDRNSNSSTNSNTNKTSSATNKSNMMKKKSLKRL